MNLKDRGIKIGDLLVFVIIITISTFIIKKLNEDRQAYYFITHENKVDIKID